MTVNQAVWAYILFSFMGGNTAYEVNVNVDDVNGSITVPKWAIAQAVGSALGYVPSNYEAYDDDALPSSIRMDSDWYEIRVDVSAFDQDKVKVKVLDSVTIRVEAKEKYVNRYGATTIRTVYRRYIVPTTYDTNKLTAQLNNVGILTIRIPSKNENVVISTNGGHVTVEY